MNKKLSAHHVITAAVVVGLAGCSSTSGLTAQSATTPTSTASSTAVTDASTSADAATSTSSADVSTSAAATSSAGGPARPSDACTLLTSDQVASAVGTPGPYNDAHEDPTDDGRPVWGCTWGTHASDADFREIQASSFQSTPDPADATVTPVTGIGDQARMITMTPDGRNPDLEFTVGGAYYDLSVTVSRSETDASNAGQEQNAERMLAKLLVAKLSS